MKTSIKKVKKAGMWCLTSWEETKAGVNQKQEWHMTEEEAVKAKKQLTEAV